MMLWVVVNIHRQIKEGKRKKAKNRQIERQRQRKKERERENCGVAFMPIKQLCSALISMSNNYVGWTISCYLLKDYLFLFL